MLAQKMLTEKNVDTQNVDMMKKNVDTQNVDQKKC